MDLEERLLKARKERFLDIYDFFEKIIKENIPKNIIELLIKAGCMDSLGYNRKTLYQNIDNLINYANLCQELGKDFVLKPEINQEDEFAREELINNEKECFGFYLSNHPVSFYKNQFNAINLVDLEKYYNKRVTCVVMIDKIKEIITKKGEKMSFLTCSDEEENVDVTVFPNLHDKVLELSKNDIVKIDGRVERRNNYSIIANNIVNVKELKNKESI